MHTASKIIDHASEGKNDEHACTNNRKPEKVVHVDFFPASRSPHASPGLETNATCA